MPVANFVEQSFYDVAQAESCQAARLAIVGLGVGPRIQPSLRLQPVWHSLPFVAAYPLQAKIDPPPVQRVDVSDLGQIYHSPKDLRRSDQRAGYPAIVRDGNERCPNLGLGVPRLKRALEVACWWLSAGGAFQLR